MCWRSLQVDKKQKLSCKCKTVFYCQILAKCKKVCYTYSMLKKYRGKRICVAVSGGEDSVALLHYLNALKEEYGYQLSAVHCEHGIRGEESIEDMRFVEDLCKAWDIPLYLFQEDCPARAKRDKESLETAARNFRYECFSQLVREGKAYVIATAHHKNDEAETVLFRLARGTSLGGMSAMKEESGYLLRPFLGWTKGEITAYITKNSLAYREDKTNFSLEATRNKIRLEILSKLEEAIPGATENILRFAKQAEEADEVLYALAKELLEETEEDYFIRFCDKKPIFTRAALMALKGLGLNKDYTSVHLDGVFQLQYLERGATLDLPKDIRAEKGIEGVYMYRKKEEVYPPLSEEKPFSLDGFDGGRYEVILSNVPIMDGERGLEALRFDREKLPKDTVFRFRKDGDKIKAFGGDTKSLKKLFNERKIPVSERAYLPLIAEKDGSMVYAVCGVEISSQLKVDEGTKEVLYIAIRKRGNV